MIDLYLIDNLYAKNSEGNITTPFYKYIYYKIFFDKYKTHKGKLIGSDDSNNDIELNKNTYSRIIENKNFRYELSEEEKNNRGAYIRLKIGIYNNQKNLISKLKDFNFFICLKEYQACDSGNPEKCSCNFNEPIIDENYLNEKSYIKLKVKGKGINRIFYAYDQIYWNFFIPPDEVIINNIKKSYVYYEYEFENDINNVILIWNKLINTLHASFYRCSNITEADLSHFDSSSLENTGRLFQLCSSLTYVNFTNFNTEHVEYMHNMFQECYSLKSLDLSNFNTQSVIDINNMFKYMFDNCKNLHYLNLKNFEEYNNNLEYNYIFRGIPNNVIVCMNQELAPDLYQLIKKLEDPYFDCSDDWFFNNNIFDYSYITLKIKGKGIQSFFNSGTNNNYCSGIIPPDEILINNKKQKYVHYEYDFEQEENEVKLVWYNHINTLQCFFYNCSNITFVDFSHFYSNNVNSIASLFDHCKSLIYVNFTNFDTSNCKYMKWMFSGCTSLISLDLSNFNTKRVENVNGMFNLCKNLKYINLKNFELNDKLDYSSIINGFPKYVKACIDKNKAFTLYQLIEYLDNSYINCSSIWFSRNNKYDNSYITLKVKGKGINRIFYAYNTEEYCSNFIPPDEVYINNTKQYYVHYEYDLEQEENEVKLVWYNHINYLGCSFLGCSNITFADLSHMDSSHVESMNDMFNACKSLKYANFRNLDTSNCKDLHFMFKDCSSLISLDLSSFDTKKVESIHEMFNGCNKLRYINLKNFELDNNLDYNNIINGIPNNIIVCINQELASDLYGLINKLEEPYFDCSDDWFINNNIFDYSYISLRLRGNGMNRIFYNYDVNIDVNIYCYKFIPPDEVLINNIKQNDVHYEYNLEQEKNEVKLVWYNKINFLGCGFYLGSNIITADLSHVDSSNIESIAGLFNSCTSLIYVNFTNFDTSNCVEMHYLFHKCSSLISVDLSNFKTPKLIKIQNLFSHCNNLQYINLKNFDLQSVTTKGNEINEVPKNVIACINQNKASYLYQLIKNLGCSNIYCGDDWYLYQKKLNKETNECIYKCNNNKYEFNSICYDECQYGIFYDEKNSVEKCKCKYEKCYSCLNFEKVNDLCITCNNSFYPIENDPINLGPYINCYKNPEGYYLDKSKENNYIYKLCYKRCKTCEIKGDETINNCLECNSEYSFGILTNDYFNCYP